VANCDVGVDPAAGVATSSGFAALKWRLTTSRARAMTDDPEQRLVEPRGEEDVAALRCVLRLRGEGKSLEGIAAGLRAETGLDLAPDAVDRVLRLVAGPAARAEGGDPDYFSGYLGGG
jgi:hypothetical protein